MNKDEKNIKNVIIFTDGSCSKKKGVTPKCGYGVYFPNKELKNISKPFTVGELTNQRAELYAIYKAIKKTCKHINFDYINIYTDSEYSIKSLTVWIEKWKQNNWKTSDRGIVANQDLIKKIDKYIQTNKGKIFFHHVKSHTGESDFYSRGNEKADRLATDGARK